MYASVIYLLYRNDLCAIFFMLELETATSSINWKPADRPQSFIGSVRRNRLVERKPSDEMKVDGSERGQGKTPQETII